MQNSYLQTAELGFWKIILPLMYRSALVRWLVRGLISSFRLIVHLINEVLDGALRNLFLFIVLLFGGMAFGVGYLWALFIR